MIVRTSAIFYLLIPILFILTGCCENANTTVILDPGATEKLETHFKARLNTHLNAVSQKDLVTLKSTLSPSGKMQLILPGSEIKEGVDAFMEYHTEWFQDTNWIFETRILNTQIGDSLGNAVTEIVYKEPNRDGKPYFNRMIVTYLLEMYHGEWYVVQDHASSVAKSTDGE